MYYYLLYNCSFEFINNNRLFTTILYGSILYILTHAILNYCNLEILNIINNYFWIIFTLDIFTFVYVLYLYFTNSQQQAYTINDDSNSNSNSNSNVNVSIR